jgi:hypothetical protein
MEEDRTLFGQGRYPDSGPVAVLARLAFLCAMIAIVVAVLLPPRAVPEFLYSHYLEHFAAYYVLMLAALASMPRTRLRRIAITFVVVATVFEASHLLAGGVIRQLMRNWVADLGGLSTAVAPVVVERYRRRFPPLPRS